MLLFDDVPDGLLDFFLTHFPDLMKGIELLKIAEIENVMNRLEELVQKLDVIAAVIFMLIDVKGESGSKQQQ